MNINIRRLLTAGAFVAFGVALAGCNLYKTQSNSTPPADTEQQQTTQPTEASGTITYSDSGFSPKEVKVKVGEALTFKNDSTKSVQVNSAPHPQHTQFPELNLGAIAAGESKSVTFTTAGTRKYHNHLDASEFGSIVVE